MRINIIMLLFATSIMSLMIGLSVLSAKDKMGSKNWYFFMICISSSVWNFGYLLIEMASDESDINLGRSLTLGGSLAASCLLIKFIYILIEGNSEKKSKIAVIAVFLALIIFPLTGAADNTVITKTSYGVSYYLKENPITIISAVYGIATILLSLIITLKWIKVSKYKRDKFQGKVIIGGILFSLTGLLGGFFKLLNGEVKIPSSLYIFFLIVIIYYFSKKYNALSITVGNLAEYIYSSANTPILILNDNKEVELVNSSAVHFFNIDSEQLIGRDIETIFNYEKENINMFEINKTGNVSDEHSFDSTCVLNNAKCNISTTSIYDKFDEFICAIFVITDLTDKMNLIEQLNESKEEAVAANEAKSAFLANMSHEIRTPMNAIIGMSEIILQNNVPNDIKDKVISIRNSGKGLLTIINDILDLSKIESGKFEIIYDEYMIPSLVTDIVNMISIRLADKPIEFIVNVDPTMPNDLIGDEIRIKQILINILGNAVKFTKKGFIKLSMSWNEDEADFYLIMKIEDSGIGIKEEDINSLFGAFNQVDTRKNRNIQGTGLGLAISKNLAELMGGNITLESEYGKGTAFTITVKQQVKDNRPIARIKNKEAEHIVIYEENEILRDSFAYTLEKLMVKYTLCFDETSLREAVSKNSITYIFVRKCEIAEVQYIIKDYNIKPKILALLNMNDALGLARNYNEVYLPLFCLQVADVINDEIKEIQYKQTGIDERHIIPMPFAKILIVDDNEVNLQVAKGLMNPYEMEIECASSGQEAINKIKTSKYDLVFMDHMMPGMDGIDATKIIRELDGEYYKEIPIVALTANALSEAREMFLSEGFNDFLAKPIELSKLNFILKKWVLTKYDEACICKEKNGIKENNVITEYDTEIDKNELLNSKVESSNELSNKKIEDNIKNDTLEIEGLDVKDGVNNVGGNIHVYMQVLETFYKETKSKIKELNEIIKNDDIKLFTTYVHGIKSSSGSIGAKEVSDLAKELEFAGKENNLDFINNNMDKFSDKILRVLENIDEFIKKKSLKNEEDLIKSINENEESGQEKIITKIDTGILEKLKESLTELMLDEVYELLKEIKEKDYDEETTKLVKQIEENLSLFEYDNSIELISEFLEVNIK